MGLVPLACLGGCRAILAKNTQNVGQTVDYDALMVWLVTCIDGYRCWSNTGVCQHRFDLISFRLAFAIGRRSDWGLAGGCAFFT